MAACAEGKSAATPRDNSDAGETPAAGSGGQGDMGAGSGGAGAAGSSSNQAGASGAAGGTAYQNLERFSFFVTSYAAMQRLSGDAKGFGGDLRFGKADGLSGADEICRQIAETSMPGAGSKGWRAFLSVTKGAQGQPIHAIDRIGAGPWYDRLGRLVAENKADLAHTRPLGADAAIIDDLPNEDGVPNHKPDANSPQVDNHDVLTGTGPTGQLYMNDPKYTCRDWTSAVGADGTPRVGHSWPRMMGSTGGAPREPTGMDNWMSSLNEAGCAPGASLAETGPPNPDVPTVGSGGGYGGIYCFARNP